MSRRLFIGIFSLTIIITLNIFTLAHAKDKSTAMDIPPAVVLIAPVKLESWQSAITATGTLAGNQSVTIKPEISGRVTAVYFHSGEDVKAGTPLLQLNADILQAQYTQSAAQAKLSEANYQRSVLLFQKKVISKADLDNGLAKFESDKASAEKAKAELNQALIRAPFDGRLGLRMVNLGDYVSSGQTIVDLVSINPLRVDFRVPEIYLNQIKSGQTVEIYSRSYSDVTFTGKVYAIDAEIDASTRTLGVRAVVDNKQGKLLPGAFVDVKLMTGSPQKLITIPQTALSYESEKVFVYKVVNGKAVKTIITTGERRGDDIAVLTGLKADDSIVAAGQLKVSDGQPVISGK